MLSINLYMYLYLSFSLSISLSIYLSIFLSIYLYIYICLCLQRATWSIYKTLPRAPVFQYFSLPSMKCGWKGFKLSYKRGGGVRGVTAWLASIIVVTGSVTFLRTLWIFLSACWSVSRFGWLVCLSFIIFSGKLQCNDPIGTIVRILSLYIHIDIKMAAPFFATLRPWTMG